MVSSNHSRFSLSLAVVSLALASGANAQETCFTYLEEHPFDAAWREACIEDLEALPRSGILASGMQEGLSIGSLGLFLVERQNISLTSCGGTGFALSQNEIMLASDPPSSRLFAISRSQLPASPGDPPYSRLFSAHGIDDDDPSTCGWSPQPLALQHGEPGAEVLPDGFSDPWAAFDASGTLWISYLGVGPEYVPTLVARSADGGVTFPDVYELAAPGTDKPVLATGPDTTTSPAGQAAGSLWVMYRDVGSGKIVAQGAALDPNGAIIMDFCANPQTTEPDAFCEPETIAIDQTLAVTPGDIDIGPGGEVIVTYLRAATISAQVPSEIFVSIDVDGLGPGLFSEWTPEADFESNLQAHEELEATAPQYAWPFAYLAWDRNTPLERPLGRVHLVYTDSMGADSDDTHILASYSDNAGATWEQPIVVDSGSGSFSQFLPDLDVDQSTGDLAVIWRDARDDPANKASHVYASVRQFGAPDFLPSVRVSEGASQPMSFDNAYFEYQAVEYEDGVMYAAWVDNSNIDGHNFDGSMDPYVAKIVPEPGSAALLLPGMVLLLVLSERRLGLDRRTVKARLDPPRLAARRGED